MTNPVRYHEQTNGSFKPAGYHQPTSPAAKPRDDIRSLRFVPHSLNPLRVYPSPRSRYTKRLPYPDMDVILKPRIYQTGAVHPTPLRPRTPQLTPHKEYEDCWQLVNDCIPHVTIEKQPENPDSFSTYTYALHYTCVRYESTLSPPGQIMTEMLPLLMMRHRRIPRAKWRDRVSGSSGKHWIEQVRS